MRRKILECNDCTLIQCLYSLSGKTSYRKISWSLDATGFDFILIQSLWNLTGTSAVVLLQWCSIRHSIRLHPITVYRAGFGVRAVWCWMSLLRLSWTRYFWCSWPPQGVFQNTELYMLSSDSFLSNVYSELVKCVKKGRGQQYLAKIKHYLIFENNAKARYNYIMRCWDMCKYSCITRIKNNEWIRVFHHVKLKNCIRPIWYLVVNTSWSKSLTWRKPFYIVFYNLYIYIYI